jgi:hypothetical protein
VPAPDIRPEIGIDDFRKVDLRVATVLRAERVPKAKKLLLRSTWASADHCGRHRRITRPRP